MAEKITLKSMRCPTCGASLKAANDTEAIDCVYCGNTIIPVTEATPVVQSENSGSFNGVLRVEGIKTPSSALAYLEQFFEEYDWEAFSYAQTLSIAEIDKLASSLKISSADDKNTWIVCFKAISVPFIRKVEGCKKILASVIEEYKKDNLDAYSKFDAYKRIASMICLNKKSVAANLEKIILNAEKYGSSATEINSLKADADTIRKLADVEQYKGIEDIPAIKTLIAEKNAKIAGELAAKGINAESEYERAKALISEEKYVPALNILLSLKGYSDSNILIDKIDMYFLISDVLEIGGKLYYFKKDSYQEDILNLYPAENGKISTTALVKNISRIVTNYADVLYYLDENKKLRKYDFSTNTGVAVFDTELNEKPIFAHNRKAYLTARQVGEFDNNSSILELDLTTGIARMLLGNIKEVVSMEGSKIIYTISKKVDGDSYEDSYKAITSIVNVDTMDVTQLGTNNVTIEGFIDNYVVYTQELPNKFNKNLYIKALNNNEPEKLIEQNIFGFCSIIADKLFYYVGNSRNYSLITINCDGTERKEWPLYISDVLFEQGGWLYFIRKAGYNSILCKSRLDGSKFSIIAADIEKFIEIKNGYLYYINHSSALVKVRMDGSNLQKLCDDVESVLAVKEDKIIFVSVDDRITTNEFGQSHTKIVKSIYSVDFSGSGKIKLAYNIKDAETYDENTVYYISAEEIKSSYEQLNGSLNILYKLDVETNSVEKLLDLQAQTTSSAMSFFTIAMTIMAIGFFIALIGFGSESEGFAAFGMLVGIVSLITGIMIKADSNG